MSNSSETLEELKKIRDDLVEKIHNGIIPNKLGKSRLTNLKDKLRKQEDIKGMLTGFRV